MHCVKVEHGCALLGDAVHVENNTHCGTVLLALEEELLPAVRCERVHELQEQGEAKWDKEPHHEQLVGPVDAPCKKAALTTAAKLVPLRGLVLVQESRIRGTGAVKVWKLVAPRKRESVFSTLERKAVKHVYVTVPSERSLVLKPYVKNVMLVDQLPPTDHTRYGRRRLRLVKWRQVEDTIDGHPIGD